MRREVESLLTTPPDNVEAFADNLRTSLGRRLWKEPIGQRLGAYKIISEIGRGGMGHVYLAERADGQFEKQVAIKLLKRGTDTDEIVQRFQDERTKLGISARRITCAVRATEANGFSMVKLVI